MNWNKMARQWNFTFQYFSEIGEISHLISRSWIEISEISHFNELVQWKDLMYLTYLQENFKPVAAHRSASVKVFDEEDAQVQWRVMKDSQIFQSRLTDGLRFGKSEPIKITNYLKITKVNRKVAWGACLSLKERHVPVRVWRKDSTFRHSFRQVLFIYDFPNSVSRPRFREKTSCSSRF